MVLFSDNVPSNICDSFALDPTVEAAIRLATQNPTQPFSRSFFDRTFELLILEETIANYLRQSLRHPTALYLFFQRYTYFNAYTSSVISRLASSIALSRYLFIDPEVPVIEEADRGFHIAMKIMIAAADEGASEGACHRSLAQLLLKSIGDYANLSVAERNQFAQAPLWLDDINLRVIEGYQGKPGDPVALIRSIGFHAASELLGDMEYAQIDKVVRYENQGAGFDQYLRQIPGAELCKHRYHPWCYILIHGRHEGAGAEACHFEHVVDALNWVMQYRPEPLEQIVQWVVEGFAEFMALEQQMFAQVNQECQVWLSQLDLEPRELCAAIQKQG